VRKLVVLVGPKGAGKTRIATMLASVFGAYAVPVEAMWIERIARVPRGAGEAARAWEREGFDAILDHALAALEQHELVVLDTTGASEHTPHVLERLRATGALLVVRVAADVATCTARALARDAAGQIPTSPEQLAAINELAARVSLAFDASFDNEGPWRELEARAWWHDLLASHGALVRAEVPTLETERTLLRPWRDEDLAPFAALNADPEVMACFERTLSRSESDAIARRIGAELDRRGVGLWAVERRDLGSPCFVGFCGLAVPTFEAPFLPAVEVGWRLAKSAWGHGLATEAARAALAHGFSIGVAEIVSFTSPRNTRSLRVMEKLGMTRDPDGDFEHPRVSVGHPLRPHVLYRLAAARGVTDAAPRPT
jgi:RimJ/RimL family protein N-acetyltransferase/predicted kinase